MTIRSRKSGDTSLRALRCLKYKIRHLLCESSAPPRDYFFVCVLLGDQDLHTDASVLDSFSCREIAKISDQAIKQCNNLVQ